MKKTILLGFLSTVVATAACAQTYLVQVKPAGSKTWGYANQKGELVLPAKYKKCDKFSDNGLAAVYDESARQYFFMDTKGEKLETEVKAFKISDAMGFNIKGYDDGLVPVKVGEKWGYFNTAGKLAVPAKYDDFNEFNDGFATVKSGSNWLVINRNGEEFAVKGAADAKRFSEKLAPFRTSDKKWGFLGHDGNAIIPAQFEGVGYFSGGLAWARTADKKVGYINPKGEWVIKPAFEEGKEFDPVSGLARVKNGGSWSYVNKAGESVSVKDTDLWGDFSQGLAKGRKGGKVGFYDAKGQWVIAPQFDGVRDFKNGYAAAEKDKKWGMIDTSGNWVIQPQFDEIRDLEIVK